MIQLKRNMHPLDQVVRVALGTLLIYVGFVDADLIGDVFFASLVGLFGVLNLIAATVSVCPVYWIAGVSTCPQPTDDAPTPPPMLQDLRRRLQISFLTVSVLIVVVMAVAGLQTTQHARWESQKGSLVTLAEAYQAELRAAGESCDVDDPATASTPGEIVVRGEDTTIVLLRASGEPYAAVSSSQQPAESFSMAPAAVAAEGSRGVRRLDGAYRVWAVSGPDSQGCRVLVHQRGVTIAALLGEKPARWFAVAGLFFIWIAVWFGGGLARWLASSMERENEKTLVQRAHRQRAEAESRMKSRFLASVSHEIRTPMNAVLGYAQLLNRETGLNSTQRKYVKAIINSSDHLLLLVNSVLDMSKLESGAVQLSISEVDLDRALDDVLRMFQLKASEKKLFLNLKRIYPEGLHLRFDPLKVQQVLINVVSNALKFTSLGGVDIRASVEDGSDSDHVRVVLEVKDTGVGLSPEDLDRVFQPFVQGQLGIQEDAGTGLGLTVSRTMARLMGGDLTATSKLGRGSLFRFEFDAERSEKRDIQRSIRRVIGLASTESASRGAAPQSAPRILIADGEPNHLGVMGATLEAVGFVVRMAKTDEEILAAVGEEPPDLVLLDLTTRSGSGLELTRRIKAGWGDEVRVVVVSTGTSMDLEARVREAGAEALLHPPVAEATLFETVGECLSVEYRYASLEQSFVGSVDLGVLPRSRIPQTIVEALISAVREGDVHAIGTHVAEVVEVDAEVGRRLTKLAHDFNYPALLHHLGASGPGTPSNQETGDASHSHAAD